MERTLAVAKVLNDLYKADNGVDMDQMRMHKMMYFVQRESLMYNKACLFNADFKGWKFGPVLTEVRSEYTTGRMFSEERGCLSESSVELVKNVYERYKDYSSWKLSYLSHGEMSWKCSREGLAAEENGNVKLKLANMKVDAARELLRRKKESHSQLERR